MDDYFIANHLCIRNKYLLYSKYLLYLPEELSALPLPKRSIISSILMQ